MPVLQFAPFTSSPSPAFFHALARHKLDTQRLDDSAVPISARYTEARLIVDKAASAANEGEQPSLIGLPGVVELDADSLTEAQSSTTHASSSASPESIRLRGLLKNFNTIEEFKDASKPELLQPLIDSLAATLSPSSGGDGPSSAPELSPFLLLTFADLKKFRFFYWFAFPGVVQKPAWEVTDAGWSEPVEPEEEHALREAIASRRSQTGDDGEGAFLLRESDSGMPLVAPLHEFRSFFDGLPDNERTVVFHDPSALLENPGWPLRNTLSYLAAHFEVGNIQVVSLRGGASGSSRRARVHVATPPEQGSLKAVGWERNEKGQLGPKMVDLSATMDPIRLASQAVDLNLKLMRWRILPSLDLEKISSTRCLLLGAGTLGCYVSRVLLGWGVRNITFVDSARVSFSNPVRQPLFEFVDSLDGGKFKAQAAADSLKRIFPGVNAQAHALSIPMPGHPVPASAAGLTKVAIQKLEELIVEHDAVFLLMDSRESRWLPTLMGASQSKIVINAALGFDSFLVMRHGNGVREETEPAPDPAGPTQRLACYFCQDSNALGNSLNDRTLDQMCTVSRPGLAAIASATAVELLVSLLCHPEGNSAPADNLPSKDAEYAPEFASPLGMVPHQLRGGLGTFQNVNLKGEAFSMCTACSPLVINEYRAKGSEMLLQAFNDPAYLPSLTGLDKLNAQTEALMDDLDWEEDGDDEDDD